MRRIGLYLQAVPHGGGVCQYSLSILEAINALPRDQFTPVVLCGNDHWLDKLSHMNCEVREIRNPYLLQALSYAWFELGLPIRMWRSIAGHVGAVRRTFIDANCDYWVFPAQDRDAYMTPVKAIAVIHDLMHRYEPQFPEVSEKGEFRRREKHYQATCRFADRVLVDSETGKTQVQECYDVSPSKIRVLPFAPPNYIESGTAGTDSKLAYSLPDKYIFYPAQFWKHKNHERLILAAKQLSRVIPDIHLLFVGGEKNNYAHCVSLVDQLNFRESVTFLGFVPDDDMPELYRRARAMVMPTFFGPTNIPPLEAFALGCPVAVSDVYGMRQQVGGAALLFDPTDIEEIERVLARLWADDELCKKLVKSGFHKIEQYGQRQFNERFLEVVTGL